MHRCLSVGYLKMVVFGFSGAFKACVLLASLHSAVAAAAAAAANDRPLYVRADKNC